MASPCPNTELLAAYLENNLAVETREQMEEHLVECRICRRIVAQVIKSESVVPDPVLPHKPLR
ncbi:MAG: zf-HC2 domain-containing protein [Terriglobia bacterium]